MPTYTQGAYTGQNKLLGAAAGTSLSTTRAYIGIPLNAREVTVTPFGFSTAVTALISLNPVALVLRTTDLFTTAANLTNISDALQDADSTTTVALNSQPTLTNGGAILIGCARPISGIYLDVVNTNSGGGTPGMYYWNGAWANTGWTDATSNLANDGEISGTLPPDWVPTTASLIYNTLLPGMNTKLYWLRWTTSVAYDSSVSLNALYTVSQYVDNGLAMASGQQSTEQIIRAQNGNCIQATTDAGTGKLLASAFVS